jgi:hypothetical protein
MVRTKGPWKLRNFLSGGLALTNPEGQDAIHIKFDPKTTFISCLQGDQLTLEASPLLLNACIKALKHNQQSADYNPSLSADLLEAITAAGVDIVTLNPDFR